MVAVRMIGCPVIVSGNAMSSSDAMSSAGPRRSGLPLVVVLVLFALAVGGAWGWFHLWPRSFANHLRLEVRRAIPGFAFTNEVMTAEALDTLAVSTNDLVSGAFFRTPAGAGPLPERFNVFYAGWSARSAKEMSVVMHTPDVCWVGAGAVPLALGQPEWVELTLGAAAVPFECRVFELQPGQRELTLWCTLVNGQIYGEAYRFAPPAQRPDGAPGRDAARAQVDAGRRAGGNQFLHAVRERVPGTGEKQFVRFSTNVEGRDWQRALNRLQRFSADWLRLQVQADPGPPQRGNSI